MYRFTRACLIVLAMTTLDARIEAGAQQLAPAKTPSAPNAKVFFVDLKDGATIPSKLKIRFGIENMEIAPAGVVKPNTGHHHLLIDTELPPLDQPIPSDFNHVHFGGGQTEVEITLPAGEHTLQLLLGDQAHIPHRPPVFSEVIHVRVDPATVEKTRTPAPAGASVFFVEPADGATVARKVTVKFGLSGMELVPAGTNKPNSGHHHLLIDAPLPALDREIPSDLNHVHFGRAQTETEITLTPGDHTLQLLLGTTNIFLTIRRSSPRSFTSMSRTPRRRRLRRPPQRMAAGLRRRTLPFISSIRAMANAFTQLNDPVRPA